MNNEDLKTLGIALHMNELLELAYAKHKVQLILPIEGGVKGLALDLNSLPIKPYRFKEIFLRWALQANEGRLRMGKEPIFSMGLVQACPLWKVIPPPFMTLKLDKESLLKQTGKTKSVIGKPTEGAFKRSKGKHK